MEYRLALTIWIQLYGRRKIQIISLLLLMGVGSIFEMAGIGLMVPFLSVLVRPELVSEHTYWKNASDNFDLLAKLDLQVLFAAAFATMVLISSVVKFLTMFVQSRLLVGISHDFSLKAYANLLRKNYEFHLRKNSSELISLINKAGDLANIFIMPMLNLANSIAIAIGVFIVIFYIDAKIALISFFSLGAMYSAIFYSAKLRIRKYSQSMSEASTDTIKCLQEGFGGIREVILDKLDHFYINNYSVSSYSQKMAAANIGLISTTPRFLVEALGVVFITIIALFMVKYDGGIEHAIPVLGALALGAQRLLPIVQQGFAAYTTLRGYIVSSTEAVDILSIIPDRKIENYSQKFVDFKDSLELRSVFFKHEGQRSFVINDINFKLKKGSRLGVVGATGCGKSTLLDILMGLLRPTEGGVYLDGKLLTADLISRWQEKIAHVPQFIYLADSSVAENIAFGCSAEDIDFSRVVACAKQAQLSDVINKLPEKYNTTVGERGVRLSGGQRQRLGIARAIYKGASVIVLDEATSALDMNTESDVIKEIEMMKKDVTMVMVAHRTTTLSGCDQIIELNAGQISWMGSYEEFSNR